MLALTQRRGHVLTGAIALVLLFAAITVGVKGAFGAFDGGYEVSGTFDAAGQGLLSGSDVKVRGVNIGQVRRIELVDGAAEITLLIRDGEKIPEGSTATIRPKTLFGEKFVDIAPDTADPGAPNLDDGDVLTNTQGGFELEQVLADTFPLLQQIDPEELTTVLSALADGADGLGEEINRTIVNSEELSKVFAENAGNTEQFLEDLAALSDELVDQADTILEVADAANVALPTLNENEGDLVTLLQQAGRLSNDVADLLEANKPFVDASFVEGSRTLQLLYDERTQVIPLVIGLRQYVETLTSVVRIPMPDGTLLAAVKGLLAPQACPVLPCEGAGAGAAAPGGTAPEPPGVPPLLLPEVGVSASGDGSDLGALLSKVLIG
jgi:phospholipid/cholesterol/gamma-HCH transport system substrate-binding protein